jgi:pimeloyl-ACP methyl ester carboxylesterase
MNSLATSSKPLELAYDDEGAGTPVVLLHGLTFDRTTWRPVVEQRAFEQFQTAMGLDRVPPPVRTMVLAHQTLSQDLVVGYSDGPLRKDASEVETEMTQTMRRVRCPYLGVFGRILTPEQRAYMTDRLVDLHIEEWPGSGHFVHLADVDRFIPQLRSFVGLCISSAPSDACL